MFNAILNRNSVQLLAALILASGGTIALACPEQESQGCSKEQQIGQVKILHDLPLVGSLFSTHASPLHLHAVLGHGATGAFDGDTVTVMTHSDGQDSYTVKIKNGELSAQANGKDLPEKQIRRDGNRIELLDEDGDVVATFHHASDAHAAPIKARTRVRAGQFTPLSDMVRVNPQVTIAPDQAKGGVMTMNAEPPPVMLGITMSDNPDDDTDGVTLTSILPGLPAEKAGLKAGDRVIEMDGKKLENQEGLRKVIRSKKPGDDLKIKIVREGDEKEMTLRLEAFSAEKMRDAGAPQWWERMQQNKDAQANKWDEARQAIERAIDQVRNNPNMNTEKMKEKAIIALENAMKSVEEAKGKMQAEVRAWAGDPNRGGWIMGDKPQQLFVTPTPPPTPGASESGMIKRMERITDQLERLDRRLDALEKRLSERDQGSKSGR